MIRLAEKVQYLGKIANNFISLYTTTKLLPTTGKK